jgi:hypothetical protein
MDALSGRELPVVMQALFLYYFFTADGAPLSNQWISFSELQTDDGWAIKDILSHLVRWEAELVKLLWQLRQGQRPTTVHFTGTDIDEINSRWLAEDRSRPLERILDDFQGVRRQTIRRIESFSDQELNDPQHYPWLKGEPLAEWVAEDSFKHEAEHLSQITELQDKKQEK